MRAGIKPQLKKNISQSFPYHLDPVNHWMRTSSLKFLPVGVLLFLACSLYGASIHQGHRASLDSWRRVTCIVRVWFEPPSKSDVIRE